MFSSRKKSGFGDFWMFFRSKTSKSYLFRFFTEMVRGHLSLQDQASSTVLLQLCCLEHVSSFWILLSTIFELQMARCPQILFIFIYSTSLIFRAAWNAMPKLERLDCSLQMPKSSQLEGKLKPASVVPLCSPACELGMFAHQVLQEGLVLPSTWE